MGLSGIFCMFPRYDLAKMCDRFLPVAVMKVRLLDHKIELAVEFDIRFVSRTI